MEIEVKHGECVGHARCAAVAPDIYVLDEEGYNRMPVTLIDAADEYLARRGANACPECAIKIIESGS